MNILIRILIALSNGEKDVAALKAISSIFGKNSAEIVKTIQTLSQGEELNLRKRFGDNLINRVKGSVNLKGKKIPITKVKSGWIDYISWNPYLKVLKLTVKTGKKKTYDLPFFPERVARAMLVNQSPGKTIWRGYWRVVGKGKVSNKAKNIVKAAPKRSLVKIYNNAIPTTRVLKIGKNRVSTRRVVLRGTIKTSNIPKTGAKGINIKIKAPRLGK